MSWFDERSGLSGSVAVVTGGAGGLGLGIVEDLVANGVRPAVVDIDLGATAALRESFDARGIDAVIHDGDARDDATLATLFAEVDDRWGRLDTLVNVVGGTFRAPFAETRAKGWDALLRANLLPVLHASALAIPRMRAGGGGSIINITTIEAHRAAPGFAVYSAAKAAIEQFARTLALEEAPHGIRVNNVAPDYVPTPNLTRIAGDASAMSNEDGIRIAIPMGRAGLISDVSNCVVFLASNLSSYLTGQTMHPDGGTHASAGWFNWPGEGWANHVPAALLSSLE